MRTFKFATDAETGTIEAESLNSAFEALAARITGAMIDDGASLWVEDLETGERIDLDA